MDMVLVVVTVMSLAIAIAMGTLVLKMVREDRRRSEARVAALTRAADVPDHVRRATVQRAHVPDDVRRATVQRANVQDDVQRATVRRANVPDDVRRANVPDDVRRATVQRAHVPDAAQRAHVQRADAGDVELRRPEVEAGVAGVGALFAEPERTSPWGSRVAVAAVLALVVGGSGYLYLRGADATGAPAAAAAPAAAPAALPLELLSLKHEQRTDALTVSGVVQNPPSGARLSRVVATAFVFGEAGAFLASGRAALDFTTLAPGDESPFVVTVPVTGRVTRYRIGFRTEDGEVIAHVDKRQADAVALK